MKLFGLTGGIACGKSTVAAILKEEFAVPIIDADVIAHEVVEPGQPALNQIVQTFGENVLKADGHLDRAVLGAFVFSDKQARLALNAITHKYVYRRILWLLLLSFFRGEEYVVVDIPLLFETRPRRPGFFSLHAYLSASLAVLVSEDVQLSRLMRRNDLSLEEAQRRTNAQMPLDTKRELADFVVWNNSTIEETRELVVDMWQSARQLPSRLPSRALVMTVLLIGMGTVVLCVLSFLKFPKLTSICCS